MTIKQVALVGDSLTQGTALSSSASGTFAIAQGGKGCWAEVVAESLADLTGVGPLLSSGLRGVWLGINAAGSTEWSFASSWTAVASTDAWDKLPYGQGQFGNGSAKIASATLPVQYRAAVGFAIYWVDYTNGGNWSYRINGGAWTAMGQTLANDNKLCKFYVASAVTPGQVVDIRCADASGTGVGCFPAGIEWFYSTATSGLIVHNLGVNGKMLRELCQVTSGDRMAFFDAVKTGTGSPITNQPNAGACIMHLNDAVIRQSTAEWAADLTTFNTRVSPLSLIGIASPWECGSGTVTSQANNRAQTKTTGASLSAKLYDLYDAWAANGYTANAGVVAAGYVNADAIHESAAGHVAIAEKLYWFIRNQLMQLGTLPSTYPFAGKRSFIETGKNPTVAYTAGLPILVK